MVLADFISIPTVSIACLAVLGIAYHRHQSNKNTRRPPGPKGYPFIGNLLELVSAERPHLLFPLWIKQYGDIVRFTVFGVENILISKFSTAIELLEKRGAIYSDRPHMVLENEILGWDAAMPTMRYGAQFRKHRKLSNALLNPNAARGYIAIHEEVSLRLLSALAAQPDQFYHHILIYATSTIFRISYDIDITDDKHDLVRLANGAVRKSAEAYQASGALVDVFPSLKWLYNSYPTTAPFSGYRKVIEDIKGEVVQANNIPYEMAKEKMRDGSATRSLVSDAITGLGGLDAISPADEHDIRGLAGILYAGQETTMVTITNTILAMIHHPEVQRKAQAEIDAVVPLDRLPTLDDRANIPYLEAFVKEAYRWACPLIIAIPHTVIQDDVYEGYFIPKGTSIIASIYDMLNQCPNAAAFNPDRFIDGTDLGDVPPDPRDVVFGFGRRRCPGLHVADNSVWAALAQLLASFEFLPELVDGKEVLPPLKWGKEMARHPQPYRCRIVPRENRKHCYAA
uniref:Cytochrome P450 monooxyhenase eriC n=1 Tax=Hericium erinaceus TaxID=91752 RepID=ERIC_HERER|nr:RecName: Full=Cytochrome P450 monooxyhenase eriC; AltName: Full=Erinacine biosynthesis cluster protein C [Hericium erinaceus]ARE72240.1 cytochrome p450 [Hericium erinaceus]